MYSLLDERRGSNGSFNDIHAEMQAGRMDGRPRFLVLPVKRGKLWKIRKAGIRRTGDRPVGSGRVAPCLFRQSFATATKRAAPERGASPALFYFVSF